MKTYPVSRTAFHPTPENHPHGEIRRPTLAFPPCRTWREDGSRRGPRTFRAAVMILIAATILTQSAFADESLLRGPRKPVRASADAADPSAGKQAGMERIASAPVLFYQRFLGSSWGQRCAYYPSCSNYALLAIRKHGAAVGAIMAFDRLQHEANEGKYSPMIPAGGEIKVYDPLENNDYWWYRAHFEAVAPVSAARE
jgi:putative component of membrane protein insertase Oxa1/YidC/SpoIIIJ protein YidD